MAYRELELTLLSARDLKNVNLFTRMDVYAVASISGDPMTRQCTPTDTSGGRNPSWNATFRFSVPPSAAAAAGGGNGWLHVLLRSQRALGDRDVGEVVVPLAELLTSADGPGPQPPRLASYQVHTVHRGEPRGVLNVSYRLGPVVAPVAERADDKPPVIAYPVPFQSPNSAPPPQPFKPQNQAAPTQPFQPQNPAPPQPYQYYPQSDSYAPPPPPYNRPHDAYAPPRQPRYEEEEALSPVNGKNGGYGPTNYYMGPHTQIILGGGAPTSPRSTNTIPAKANDGRMPKPSYTPTQPKASQAKTDYSWSKASPQHQDTPTWPNASPKRPDRATQPITNPAKADYSWPNASPQKPDRPTQPIISPSKTDYSWSKTSPQHHDTPTWPDASLTNSDRPTRHQHDTKVVETTLTRPITSPGKNDHSWPKAIPPTQSKIDAAKIDHSTRPQGPQEQNIQVTNISARKTNGTQEGKADATRPKEAYANTRSNSTRGKADHQQGHKAVLHSLPTATAR